VEQRLVEVSGLVLVVTDSLHFDLRKSKKLMHIMQTAQRAVFDRSIIEGYRTAKTDAIAVAAQGRRLFSGTSDGSIVMYDCKMDMVGSTSKQHVTGYKHGLIETYSRCWYRNFVFDVRNYSQTEREEACGWIAKC
jgi:hypothetical protein